MKTIRTLLLFVLVLFIAGKASSQISLIIFSEKGEKFTAYVNNSIRNESPASRVETDRPGGPSFKLRIVFEDSSFPEITKTIFNTPGPDLFYVIRKADNGKFLLEKTSSEYSLPAENETVSGEKSTTKDEKSATMEAKSESKPAGEKGKGCSDPMDEPDFIASREMISNAPFDGPKLSQAKNLTDKNCLTTSQIVDMIYIFSGESSRLSFAKYAYTRCWDPDNYDTVKEALNSSSQDSMQQYIESLN